jgi:hypothetical protein
MGGGTLGWNPGIPQKSQKRNGQYKQSSGEHTPAKNIQKKLEGGGDLARRRGRY